MSAVTPFSRVAEHHHREAIRRTVIVVLPSYGAARDALLSGTLGVLSKEADIRVFSPLTNDQDFADDMHAQFDQLQDLPRLPTTGWRAASYRRLTRVIKKVAMMNLAAKANIATILIEENAFRNRTPVRYLFWRFIRLVVARPLVWNLVVTARDALIRPRNLKRELEKADLVILFDLFNQAIDPVIAALRTVTTSRFGVLQSWDNLSSKGVLPVRFDGLSVWNEQMRAEVLNYYDEYRVDEVIVAGGLMFDVVRKPVQPRRSIARRFGVTDQRKIITLLLGYPDMFAGIYEHIEMLVRAVDEERLREAVLLIIRTQPGERSRPVSRFLNRYARRVLIDDATDRAIASWSNYKQELAWYNDLVAGSDVVVNYTSTSSIDAARLGTPNVSIAFDGTEAKPYWVSMRRYVDRTHYRWIAELGGNRISNSEDELIENINQYLKDPTLDEANRRRLALVGGPLDNSAGRRLGQHISSILSEREDFVPAGTK